jgi:predicted nuclease of predicted toxin-antitoxin system
MKRLVADEGVDKAIVEALRADGFDVTYFAESGAGSLDTEVLAAARHNHCPLVTCDKDFGELVFRQGLTSAGVVLIRLNGMSADSKARTACQAIVDHLPELLGAFTVISPGTVRIRSAAGS